MDDCSAVGLVPLQAMQPETLHRSSRHKLLGAGSSSETDITAVMTSSHWWPATRDEAVPESRATRPGNFETQEEDLEVFDMIGEGSRSQVFEGSLRFHNRRVAVKKLRSGVRPDRVEQRLALVRDLETLADTLCHPNIVECLGVTLARNNSGVSLLFEYMGGGTLEDYYCELNAGNEGQPRTAPTVMVLSWCSQLFAALCFLHERSEPIIHRDLKPHNLLLSADWSTLKIRDFGLHKTADLGIRTCSIASADPEIRIDLSDLTRPSHKCFTGTQRYMAPELNTRAGIHSPYTCAVDIYSAGLIMWFMLHGRAPWEAQPGVRAHATAKRELRPTMDHSQHPEGICELIEYCWAHAPDERPAASEILECLGTVRRLAREA